jgi:hypothetical protein
MVSVSSATRSAITAPSENTRRGVSNLWEKFNRVKDTLPDNAGRGGIGTPQQIREHLERYEATGVDQIIFVQQSGINRHEHICDSLKLFASEVIPEFKARERVREARKQAELRPYIEAAMARKQRMPAIAEADIPKIEAFGRQKGKPLALSADRGGAISIPVSDPSEG